MAFPGLDGSTKNSAPARTGSAHLNDDALAQERAALVLQQPESLHPIAKALEKSSADAPQRLDPKKVRWSQWGNRLPQRFEGLEFHTFVEDIRATKGNNSPGVVRKLAEPDEAGCLYEIASGHRRHQACLVAEMPFTAFVKEMTDLELHMELETENRNRVDTAPFERALQYKNQLPSYTSASHMAAAMQIPNSTMWRYLILADLPTSVLDLIQDPLEISLEAGFAFVQNYRTHTDEMDQRIAAIESGKYAAKEVFAKLKGGGEKVKKVSDLSAEMKGGDGNIFATMTVNRAKQLRICIEDVSPTEFEQLKAAIAKLKRK